MNIYKVFQITPPGSLRGTGDRISELITRFIGAVLIAPQDPESLDETLAVIGDAEVIAESAEVHRACLEGDVAREVEAVKARDPVDR